MKSDRVGREGKSFIFTRKNLLRLSQKREKKLRAISGSLHHARGALWFTKLGKDSLGKNFVLRKEALAQGLKTGEGKAVAILLETILCAGTFSLEGPGEGEESALEGKVRRGFFPDNRVELGRSSLTRRGRY